MQFQKYDDSCGRRLILKELSKARTYLNFEKSSWRASEEGTYVSSRVGKLFARLARLVRNSVAFSLSFREEKCHDFTRFYFLGLNYKFY